MAENQDDYAGDLSPREAWRLLETDGDAVLIDVRTEAEWRYVGLPRVDALDRPLVLAEWQRSSGEPNPNFVEEVKAHGVSPDAPLLLLCRSGVRSRSAAIALTRAGYRTCFNVADGFEGPLAPDGRRTVAGWKVEGLPWRQS